MNEFYRPDRDDANESSTTYAEPQDSINIVVDRDEKPANVRRCSRCGCAVEDTDVFCSKCGANVKVINTAPSYRSSYSSQQGEYVGEAFGSGSNLKNKYVSLVLCFFFGLLGIHKFYEGKIFSGLVKGALLIGGGIASILSLFLIVTLELKGFIPLFLGGASVTAALIWWIVDFVILCGKPKKYKP